MAIVKIYNNIFVHTRHIIVCIIYITTEQNINSRTLLVHHEKITTYFQPWVGHYCKQDFKEMGYNRVIYIISVRNSQLLHTKNNSERSTWFIKFKITK